VTAPRRGDVPADLLPLRFVPSPDSRELGSRCAFRGIPVAGSRGVGSVAEEGSGAIRRNATLVDRSSRILEKTFSITEELTR
jgi:hypothetical protein